ncbi:MAG: hypothetical protein OWT27_04290 [Firmicutes bacterium]|nr:hypothetical protein [Bacillota bacterium]
MLWVLTAFVVALCVALALASRIPVRVRVVCALHGTRFRCVVELRALGRVWRTVRWPATHPRTRTPRSEKRSSQSWVVRRVKQRALAQVRNAGSRGFAAACSALAAQRSQIVRSLRAVACERLSLRISLGAGSAPATAIAHGALCAALGTTAGAVIAVWPPRRPAVFAVRPRFGGACCQARLHCIAMTTPGKAIRAAVRLSLVMWAVQRAIAKSGVNKGDTYG